MTEYPKRNTIAFLSMIVDLAHDQILSYASVQVDESFVSHLQFIDNRILGLKKYRTYRKVPKSEEVMLYYALMYAGDEILSMVDSCVYDKNEDRRAALEFHALIKELRIKDFGKTVMERIDEYIAKGV